MGRVNVQHARQMSDSIELGIVLALAGGFMDAYSYIGRDGVFANAQTGNILLTGVHLSEGNLALAARYLVPVLCFAAGIVASDFVHERISSRLHWRQVTVLVEAVIFCLVSFLSENLNLTANCLISFACGMQVESFRKIHGRGMATTMCIGNLRSALQSVDDYVLTHERGFLESSLLYFGAILCFVCGAVLGNWCLDLMGLHATLVCAGLLVLAFALMLIDREKSLQE